MSDPRLNVAAHRQAALLRLSTSIALSSTEDEICDRVVHGLHDEALGYDFLGLFLLDESTCERVLRASVGWDAVAPGWRMHSGEGVSELALLERKLRYTPDVRKEGRYFASLNLGSEIDVPLVIEDKAIGVLVVESRQPNAFGQEDFEILNAAASQAGMAIQRERLIAEERRRARERQALLETMTDLSRQLELSKLLQIVLERAVALLNISGGELAIYEEEHRTLRVVASHNIGQNSVGTRLALGEGAMGSVAETLEPLIIPDYPQFSHRSDKYSNVTAHAVMVVPLLIGTRLVGTIAAVHNDFNRAFGPDDLRLLDLFAVQAAIAIENARLYTEAQQLFLEDFSLSEMLDQVITTVRPLVDKNGNQFVVENVTESDLMHSDLTRVRQILLNLLSNASKFTSNGTITLRIEDSFSAGMLRFSISDTGIGMTERQLENLFEAFSQADASVTRKYGGTGLGLAISRRFTEMLSGDIKVRSVLNEGSTFVVTLPRRSSISVRVSPPSDKVPEQPKGPCVLVIDDDPATHDILRRSLNREGFDLLSAYTGEQGLELARSNRPIAIVLDILMPSMDGWTVLGKLKSDPETADIPVVIASVVQQEHMAVSLGASDYASKPIDRDRLLGLLSRYCTGTGVILVVDDDAGARELLRRGICRDGWTVIEAANGADALRAIEMRRPDIILLDLLMPTMDGFQFLRELRGLELGSAQHIPVIVVTAKELTAEDRQSLSSSVHNILDKGMAGMDILNEVRAAARAIKQGV